MCKAIVTHKACHGLCVCLYVCVCIHVCIGAHALMYVWRPEEDIKRLSVLLQCCQPHFFEVGSLHEPEQHPMD